MHTLAQIECYRARASDDKVVRVIAAHFNVPFAITVLRLVSGFHYYNQLPVVFL
jgi:hypothetical protein